MKEHLEHLLLASNYMSQSSKSFVCTGLSKFLTDFSTNLIWLPDVLYIKKKCCEIVKFSIIAQKKPTCEAKVDIAFLLDSSGSLKDDYSKEKNFLKTLAASFGIKENGARAGVITFSYYVEHSVKLNDYFNLDDFNQAVDKIPLMGHTTRIDKALRLTQKEMFTAANGGREGVNKIVIVLTDGSQTKDNDSEDPGQVAKELRNMGYTVLAIGIGKGVNSTELADIAGDKNNVYSAATFDELITTEFLDNVNKKGCDEGKDIEFFRRSK